MARESQGLQIALIIFVVLAITLGATTFIYVRQFNEKLQAAVDADKRTAEATAAKTAKETECAELKRMIGMAEKSTAEIKEQFDADMKRYGSNFTAETQMYSPMLKRLYEACEQKSDDAKKKTEALADLEQRFAAREAAKDAAMKRLQTEVQIAGDKSVAEQKSYADQRSKIVADEDSMQKHFAGIKRDLTNEIEGKKAEVVAAKTSIATAQRETREKSEVIRKLTNQTMDVPAGEITWVNPRLATVWINLGAADQLPRQTSFNVYGADSAEIGKAKQKAKIEITKIQGDHTAEARIVSDSIADPIMPGDKIHTPLWAPGERIHYALTGVIDLDGDGRNQVNAMKNLIERNGGEVDAWLDEKGARNGQITARTRYLVMGDEPKGESKGHTAMVSEAERLAVEKVPLTTLKQRMGYKKLNTVERFGRDAGGSDISSSTAPAPAPARRPAPKAPDGQ